MSARISVVPTLARRFLLSKVSDRFLSFIAWVSVLGVALGVLTLVVVTSVINGFEGELMHVITGMNGDVILYSRADPVGNPAGIETKIRRLVPETLAITDTFVLQLMASGAQGVSGAVLEGIDLDTIGTATEIPKRVISGRLPVVDGEVAVGSSLADRLGVNEGSPIRLIIPFTMDSQADENKMGSPKVVDASVVGIVRMGMYEYDSQFVFANLPWVQKFIDQPGKVTSFKLKLLPKSDSVKAAERLSDNFGYPFRARDWAQLNKNLLHAIRLEKVVITILLTVIVVVAAFNVVSTLMMMIHDKTKEIAILKAMGFRPSQSFGLFCIIGVGMGLVGTASGVAIGLGINWILSKTHWISLPSEIYYIGFLPVVIRWQEIGFIVICAILISFFATLYPAIKVWRRSPIEGLRYD